MSTVVLSAASAGLPGLQALSIVLEDELRRAGQAEIRSFDLAAMRLAYCQGEFDCWTRTPGQCRAHDAEGAIVQAIHDASQLVLLDVVTFGGHSYTLKRAQDRLICLLSPFFERRASLTHHAARYERAASLFALGWAPVTDAEAAQTWRELADANAVNMLAPRVGATVVGDADRAQWPAAIRSLLASSSMPGAGIAARAPLRQALLQAAAGVPRAAGAARPRSAALVVGSAKARGKSASENMALALAGRLEAQGVATTLHAATDFLRDQKATATAREVAAADLLVLVTPLYVDALPALATRALECVARVRADAAKPGRFAALVNCGFPEAEHNRTALRIARHFAASAGYEWAGGLPLGGGGALDPAVPLDAQHGPAEHVKKALDLAAPSLAQGDAIPPAAIERMAASPMPDILYRFVGDMGWRYRAYKNGLAQAALRARPLG
jgi:multimeric flavodoxin WrbA